MSFEKKHGNHSMLSFEGDEVVVDAPTREKTGGKVFGLYILLPVVLIVGLAFTMLRLRVITGHRDPRSQSYPGDEDNLKTPPAESFNVPPLVYRDWSGPAAAPEGDEETPGEIDPQSSSVMSSSTEQTEETTPAEESGVMT